LSDLVPDNLIPGRLISAARMRSNGTLKPFYFDCKKLMQHSSAYVLILEDDADVACAAELLLRRRYARVGILNHPSGLDAVLAQAVPDLILLDFNFAPGRIDGAEGLAVIDRLRQLARPPAIIAMTAYADVPLAVDALKRGATDFITKPWDNARLVAAIDQALAQRAPQLPSASLGMSAALMGDSKAMQAVKSIIASVAPTEANVMILGENGVGKELVARAIHAASQRAAHSMLAVDMGALPESTFESELFGHRKGSFTDARSDRAGRFQAAKGGSLFLDEIGNMPLAAQAKLLTALERRQVTPLGADRPESIDVRIISATNLHEASLFNPAVFRSDLLFRLNTIVIRVPPLRERREDIPQLLAHYLQLYQEQYRKPALTLAQGVLASLCAANWPGNVRALRHACERAVILTTADEYHLHDFGLEPQSEVGNVAVPAELSDGKNQDSFKLDTLERETIVAAMAKVDGNISHAAKLLGVSRAALYRKLERYGI
jgi:DNA-binding NtrC family response regulator